jgi:hypothetical protein
MGYLRPLNTSTDVVGEKLNSQFLLLHLLKPGGYMNSHGLKLKNSTFCPHSANMALYFVKRAQPTNTNFTGETR